MRIATPLLAAATLACLSAPSFAADLVRIPTALTAPEPFDQVHVEFGTRIWLGFSTTSKDLYDSSGSTLLSRLTYGSMPIASSELMGSVATNEFFLDGAIGIGDLHGGNLTDEDFPPAEDPYSKTNSNQVGSFSYATLDFGRYFYDDPGFKLGAFVGYNQLHQQLNAFGCTQEASNSNCAEDPLPDWIKVVSQDDVWHSLRLGLKGEFQFDDRWSLGGNVAYLPYVVLSGGDTHTPDPYDTPEDGTGWGAQLEAMVHYKVSNDITLGVGGRYWHMQTNGAAHFDETPRQGLRQVLTGRTDLLGLLVEAKAQF